MLTSRSASLRLYALVLTALVSATHARAGIITTYTDYSAWRTDAQAAGLTVSGAGRFPSSPFQYQPFPVGPARFVVHSGTAAQQLIGQQLLLGFYDVTPGSGVFGLGFNFSIHNTNGFGAQGGARIQVTDADDVGQLAYGYPGETFCGIIGTSAFDPRKSWALVDIAVQGSTTGDFCTLSVPMVAWAAVPEPGGFALLSLALASALRRRRFRPCSEPAVDTASLPRRSTRRWPNHWRLGMTHAVHFAIPHFAWPQNGAALALCGDSPIPAHTGEEHP